VSPQQTALLKVEMVVAGEYFDVSSGWNEMGKFYPFGGKTAKYIAYLLTHLRTKGLLRRGFNNIRLGRR
jgi:hypothetical protein